MQTPIKKQYLTPILKEHGIVRELTQTGSGSKRRKDKNRGWKKNWKNWKRKNKKR